MDRQEHRFVVASADQAGAGQAAEALADRLREVEGVLDADRGKADADSMDLGSVVTVLASSGAAVAIAQGIAAWLRNRRQATLTIERDGRTGSLKAKVEGIDAAAALRITELVRG
ncbi:effector-associated constant component EACC1 [Roseicella sp. DB1501]|uniref:effector-associated constant component EACC1 n=1 Tax=Roseicella sp. DB1501 TaxID=2730925 RepID=UPI001491A41B|nr:hypothetical protein [Roseicella sp. DB1501]NOG71991.1 hypothetical protein [Roseicella sp. DB1501]